MARQRKMVGVYINGKLINNFEACSFTIGLDDEYDTEILKAKLQESVQQENYEEAAKIRDRINEINDLY